MFLGQAQQDKFVVNVLNIPPVNLQNISRDPLEQSSSGSSLNEKKNGYFVEIGSNDPIHINNTYVLENTYEWKGIMIEMNESYLPSYKIHRPNSIHVIQDATQIDYKQLFVTNNVPVAIDYLQIDLEVNNGSTLQTLKQLENDVFDTYKFATITFEHDIYYTNVDNTREASRDIFRKHGYYCVFEDISNDGSPYEDWYVHPDLVDMNYIKELQERNQTNYYFSPRFNMNIIGHDTIEYPLHS